MIIMVITFVYPGSYFLLYDFMTSFNKEDPSLLTRSQYEVIMSKIFKHLDPLQFSATLFQVPHYPPYL
jgi:hypothetical protein